MEFERVREFVRGPYLAPGYMYANQIPLAETEALAAQNRELLPRLHWINTGAGMPPDALAGRALFAANCGVCHTESGINGIDQRLAGRPLGSVNAIVGITQQLAPFMVKEKPLHYVAQLSNVSRPAIGKQFGGAVGLKGFFFKQVVTSLQKTCPQEMARQADYIPAALA